MTARRVAAAVLVALVGSSLVAVSPLGAQGGGVVAGPSDWAYPEDGVDQRAPVNGCGSQGADGVDVPDQFGDVSFTPACNWHDRCYGTKGLSQSYCDRGMLAKNLDACGDRGGCRAIAKVYYLGVAAFGGDPYREGQQLACDRDPRRDGRLHGDPHLVTLDGTSYQFMAAGEFAVMRDSDGTDLLQARFYPTSDVFTVVTGIAVRLGEREVVAQLDPDTGELSVFVDAQPITRDMAAFDEGLVELGTGLEGVRDVVSIRGWDGLHVEALVFGSRMDLSVHVPESRWGRISGLLGDADGDPADDLVDARGAVLDPRDREAIYDDAFVGEHRLSPDESMFLPRDGEFDYHGPDIDRYPTEIASLDDFPAALVADAEQRCRGNGLDGDLLESCTFDVVVSGDESYAETAARSAERARDVAHPHELPGDAPGITLVERPPLVEAVEARDIDAVRTLLDQGADVDVGRESDGFTPLSMALLLGADDIARLLLERGADPNAFDSSTLGPLQIAATIGRDVEMVRLLLEAGADPDTGSAVTGDGSLPPLAGAAGSGNLEIVEVLLRAGADPDGPPDSAIEGITPLFVAAQAGNLEVIERLLEAGADPDGRWDAGESVGPLFGAVTAGRADIVEVLVAAGADPRSATPDGTPVELFTQDEEILRLLGR